MFKRSSVRYGRTPEPETPYQKAAQVWDERIGSARAQAYNWRLIAFGNLFLAGGLAAALVWQAARGSVVPWVVQVDKLGEAQAVAAAVADYKPTDPQIAWHLARFIENVRSIPSDPIIVRQDWLKAYDFVTDKGALALNDYARANDPFAKIIEAVGGQSYADVPIGLLSGGQQQRLRIAQALAGRPRLLLCDEPLLSLDPAAQEEIVAVIDRHRREHGTTVVYVTHEITPIADVVDQVLYVAAGRWAAGSPDTVLTTQSLSALYGTHIDVIRVHDHIVIVGGDGAGGCTHPADEAAGHHRDRHDGHAGRSPEGHQR